MQITIELFKEFFKPTIGKILFTIVILYFSTMYCRSEFLTDYPGMEYYYYFSGFPFKFLRVGGDFGRYFPEQINYLYLVIDLIILYSISCIFAIIKSWHISAIAIIPYFLFLFINILYLFSNRDFSFAYLIFALPALLLTKLFQIEKYKIIIAIMSIFVGLFEYELRFGSYDPITYSNFLFWYFPAISLIFAGIHCLCFYKKLQILKS